MKVLDIIKTLVRKDENRSREDHLSELVPIDLVFRGYGFWGGKHPFKFDPHPDYKKKKPYEKIIDTDDNDKRCKGLSSINEDIDKYNEWISEKNRLSTELLLKTVQHPTIAIDNKDLNLAINTPSILRKFPYWRFVMVKASPKYRKLDKTNSHAEIDDKQLYLLKEKIPVGEFVKRFNKTIFDCLLKERQEAEKLDIWDGEHTWWYPLREFANWFSKNGIDSSSVDSFINGNKEIFLPSVSILTQKQMSYIKLYKMTNQHISAYPITAGEEKMSVRKAVKIIYNSHPDEFPDWAEGSLNKCYHLGLDLTINSDWMFFEVVKNLSPLQEDRHWWKPISPFHQTVNFKEGIFITDNARISFSDLYSISHVTDGTMTIKNGKRGCMYGGVGGVLLGFFSALVNDKGPPMNPFAFGLNWDGIIIDERTKSYK